MNNHLPHIMHIIDSLSVGGAERMAVDIVNNIDRQAFSVSMCATRRSGSLQRELKQSIPFITLDRRHTLDLNGFQRLKKYSKELQVDIFHAHGRSTFSFLCTARLLGFIHQPLILHDHYGNIEYDKYVPWWFNPIGIPRLASYIGVCELLADWAISNGVMPDKVTVIQNGLDFRRFEGIEVIDLRSILKIPSGMKICLMIGNLRPAKGLDQLISACESLPCDILPAFVIIGKPADPQYMVECKKRLVDYGLKEHFYFVGQQEDVIPWIKEADFGVIPSRSESGPLVMIEYLACGLPFVAFNVGGISRQVSGLLPKQFANPGDIQEFGNKLRKINSMSRTEMSMLARKSSEIARKSFDIKNRIPAIEQIYRALLKEKV